MSEQTYKTKIIPALQALYPFAVRLTRDPSDAEDLIQDTALRAWGAIESYDPERPAKAWLRTIMINRHRNRQRARALRPELSRDDVDGVVEIEPETVLDRHATIEMVRSAIDRLPPHQAEAIRARMETDNYGPAVAEALGITWGTLCSRINRGSTAIREMIAA